MNNNVSDFMARSENSINSENYSFEATHPDIKSVKLIKNPHRIIEKI